MRLRAQLGATNDQATLTAVQRAQQNLNDVGFKTEIVQIEQSAYITQALLGTSSSLRVRNHGGTFIDRSTSGGTRRTPAPRRRPSP